MTTKIPRARPKSERVYAPITNPERKPWWRAIDIDQPLADDGWATGWRTRAQQLDVALHALGVMLTHNRVRWSTRNNITRASRDDDGSLAAYIERGEGEVARIVARFRRASKAVKCVSR